jgi:glycosyltransferase involved in cell wall biosynthesis
MYSSIKRCDVFVSSFILNSYTLVGLVLCKLFCKKVIVWEEWNVIFPEFSAKVLYTLMRILCRGIDAFFVLGEVQKSLLTKLGVVAERIFVANEYPGHIYSEVSPREVSLPFDENTQIIMYMGRFVEFKGVEYLIRAFGIVERQRQNAALLIVGYGPLKDHLEAVSQSLGIKRIHFAGDITDVHVRAYLLKRSNMVVVPSIVSKTPPRQEGGPLVVLEALSAGKPVICTNATGSAAAFIKDGINGYMVPQKNVDALADKIKRLLDTPIVPTRVLSTFREIKGYDHQVEQMQRAVNYCLKRES